MTSRGAGTMKGTRRMSSPNRNRPTVNQPIQSNVVGGRSFLLNVSVNYPFRLR
jgi:hypothetical protein